MSEASASTLSPSAEPAILPALLRLPMSALVAISALAGYLAFPLPSRLDSGVMLTFAVLLLACGCSALNQAQEHADDARMERTRQRPIPSGRLRRGTALLVAGALICFGLLLLGRLPHPVAGYGVGAVLLYNGLYTGLKKRTTIALPIGALCGALPPLMGWCAAGGDPADHRIVGLTGLFLLWQIPHTWLLSLRHYGDSMSGPFASLLKHFEPHRMSRLNRSWGLALAIATLNLPAFGTLHHPAAQFACLALSAWLLCGLGGKPASLGQGTKRLTLYMAALICLVILDNLPF